MARHRFTPTSWSVNGASLPPAAHAILFDHEPRCARRRDYDVGLLEGSVQVLEASRFALHGCRDFSDTFRVATDDDELRAALTEEPRHGLSHVS